MWLKQFLYNYCHVYKVWSFIFSAHLPVHENLSKKRKLASPNHFKNKRVQRIHGKSSELLSSVKNEILTEKLGSTQSTLFYSGGVTDHSKFLESTELCETIF